MTVTLKDLQDAPVGTRLREELDRNHEGPDATWGYSEYVKQDDGTWKVVDSDHAMWMFVQAGLIDPPPTTSEQFSILETQYRRYNFVEAYEVPLPEVAA